MSVKLEFYISDKDMDRLWAIKVRKHKYDMTGNEFAKHLLENELYRLCPHVPKEDVEEN